MTTIVFSHANGFPAGTYRMLFDEWRAEGYAVHAVEKFGHDPHRPPTNNWPGLRDELIALIERDCTDPVHLVGHSLGGWCSVLAAAHRPDLVKGIVLIDSPLMSSLLAGAIRLTKPTPIFERFSPGHVSKGRRQHWPSADAALSHFAAKKVFARWEPQVLRDYIACGVEPDADAAAGSEKSHTLSFRRDIETSIYNTLPHHIGSLLRAHPLRCPMAFIGGTESVEVRQLGMRNTQRLTHGRVSWIKGSHLFPFEKPTETADEVLRWLAQFSSAKHES